MTDSNPQVPWTEEQWARANRVIQEEGSRARVAATFLPLTGPLPPDADFVRAEVIRDGSEKVDGKTASGESRITIEDTTTIKLATLQAKVFLRGAQMADPDMSSALQLLRRAANLLARQEDTIVFRGDRGPDDRAPPTTAGGGPAPVAPATPAAPATLVPPDPPDPPYPLSACEILGGEPRSGLFDRKTATPIESGKAGERLVSSVSNAVGELEARRQFGPFALVFGQDLFREAQTPNESLVLPQDRIIPFLGGGPLLRSSTLPPNGGVVVALGGAPIDLVIAKDMCLNFLQVTAEPYFVFRVYEKMVLRIKQRSAVMSLLGPQPEPGSASSQAIGTPLQQPAGRRRRAAQT